MKFKDFLWYVVAQMAGAAVGAALLFWLVLDNPEFNYGGVTGDYILATNIIQPGATPVMALMVEALLTFFFVFIVLGATSKIGNASLAGVVVGLALGLVNIIGIPVDNCSVNPARSFGPAFMDQAAFKDFWVMVAGPLFGAIAAAVVWKGIIPSKTDQDLTA